MPVPELPTIDVIYLAQTFIDSMFGSIWLFFFLILLSAGAGMLRGKTEGDENPKMKNLTKWDWIEDGLYGALGGIFFIGFYPLLSRIIPELSIWFMPAFGWAGRMILIKVGKKAEDTISNQ